MRASLCLCIAVLALYLAQIDGVPTGRAALRSLKDDDLIRDAICILKGLTPRECNGEKSSDLLAERRANSIMDPSLLADSDDAMDRPLSRSLDSLPLPPASKREAFYSDWRRRK